jgi:hypothetical protein
LSCEHEAPETWFFTTRRIAARKFDKTPVSFVGIQARMRLQKPGFLRKYLVAASKFDKNPVSFVIMDA